MQSQSEKHNFLFLVWRKLRYYIFSIYLMDRIHKYFGLAVIYDHHKTHFVDSIHIRSSQKKKKKLYSKVK